MKKLLYLLFAICLIGCSDDDDNASAQTFFEKYDGVVWLQETNYDQVLDKSLSRTKVQFFKDKSAKSYYYENNNGDIDKGCNPRRTIDNSKEVFSNITEDSFTITYVDDNQIIGDEGQVSVWTVKDNTLFMDVWYGSIANNGEPDEYNTYSRTSLDDPCE